jgi:hypothetical protein
MAIVLFHLKLKDSTPTYVSIHQPSSIRIPLANPRDIFPRARHFHSRSALPAAPSYKCTYVSLRLFFPVSNCDRTIYSLSFVIKRYSGPPLSPVCLLFPDSLASPSCSSSMVTLLAHWLFSRCSLNWDIKNNICSSIAKYLKKLVSLDR